MGIHRLKSRQRALPQVRQINAYTKVVMHLSAVAASLLVAASLVLPAENKTENPVLDITNSDSVTVLVNKQHPLKPQSYVPANLKTVGSVKMRGDAAYNLEKMLAAAKAAGAPLNTRSGYRSYDTQKVTYQKWVNTLGAAKANLYSAKPGQSEHQTGLAIDLASATGNCQALSSCMANTPGGKWLVKHSYEYGFILRYEKGQTDITGYNYEPWHFRFVGIDVAKDYHAKGFHTYEEYLKTVPTAR